VRLSLLNSKLEETLSGKTSSGDDGEHAPFSSALAF
jgi:hypothetical protein